MATIEFFGRHRELEPMSAHPDLERLPSGPAEALSVALRFGAGTAPDVLLVCNAALLLITELAVDVPIVLLVEDGHWIDRASAVVLGFIARRSQGRRAGLLVSIEAGQTSFVDRRGLPEQVVEPLDSPAARQLIAANHPDMTGRVRRRLLDLAQGDPLALIDLPATLPGGSAHSVVTQPEVVPLSGRAPGDLRRAPSGTPMEHRVSVPASKTGLGLEQHQHRRWRAWHRWTTLVIAVHAFLAAASATSTTSPNGLIAITANELRRLFHALVIEPAHPVATSSPGPSSPAGTSHRQDQPLRPASPHRALKRISC